MADNKVTFQQRISNFLTFVWNPQTHELLGRSGKSWGEITLFYIIYYACLAGFFAACIAVFNTTLDEKFPRLTAKDSLLKSNPGMGFKPMPDLATTLIRYDRQKPETYEGYVKHIRTYLEDNHLNPSPDMVDCSGMTEIRPDQELPCRVDLNQTLDICGPNFGYDDGKPCVLLKLNKIFNWIPEAFESPDEYPADMPQSLRDIYNKSKVWITCQGENFGDADNIKTIEYWPSQGFDMKYFPFQNQKNYLQPLIFARFPDVVNHVGMLIECKAWAKNIWHDRQEKQGSIHFEMIID